MPARVGGARDDERVTSPVPSTASAASRPLVLVAAAVTVLLWAFAFVAIRGVADELSPGPLALVRLGSALPVLLVIAAIARPAFPRGRGLVLVLAYGVAWFGAYTVVLNWAEHHLDAGTAAMLVNVAPLLVAVVAGLTFGEGFPRPLVVGLVVAFAGVVLIALGSRGAPAIDGLGIALGLLAAVLYAAGVLTQKVALRTVEPVAATWVGCAAGLVATLPFAPQAVVELQSASTGAIVAALALGVGSTAIAFSTWAYVLQHSGAGPAAATTLVVPALATLIAWLALGEVPTLLALIGGALALGGVTISRLRPRRRRDVVVESPAA